MEPIKLFNCLKVFGDDSRNFLLRGFVSSLCGTLTTQPVCMRTYIYPIISQGFLRLILSELPVISAGVALQTILLLSIYRLSMRRC